MNIKRSLDLKGKTHLQPVPKLPKIKKPLGLSPAAFNLAHLIIYCDR